MESKQINVTSLFHEVAALPTEQRNEESQGLDTMSITEILTVMNSEDKRVAVAIEDEISHITIAVEEIVKAFQQGGKLLYVGAGTSGRLGVVDASECPPTFGTSPEMVQGIIAGGKEAMFESQEGAEDDKDEARRIIGETVCAQDVVCGLAASGRTPFVVSALAEAQKKGAFTILITTNNREQLQQLGVVADCFICPNVGPEVLTGSTRLKSGTAQKMVLNMLTTASMVRLGKVFGNVMVDLQSTNKKLVERSKKVIMETTGLTYQEASDVLRRADGHVKTAIVMTLLQVEQDSAREMLDNAQGFVQEVLAQYKR